MNPNRRFNLWVTTLALCLLVALLLAPFAQLNPASAQDSETTAEAPAAAATTEVPTLPATNTATKPPTQAVTQAPTQQPTEALVPEVTQSVTEVVVPEVTETLPTPATEESTPVSEVTQEPTAEPTAEPTTDTPPVVVTPPDSLFQDDFQDSSTAGWALTPGWQLESEGDNVYLAASTPGETATILNLSWEHLLFAAMFRVDPGSTVSVAVRSSTENYTITLSSDGSVGLYRSGALLAEWSADVEPASVEPEATPEAVPDPVWRKLNIQVLGDKIIVAVDRVTRIDYTDPAPITGPGLVMLTTGAANTGSVAVDDVVINRLELPVETPTEVIVTETPVPTQDPEVTEEPVGTEISEVTEEPTVNPEVTPEVEVTEEIAATPASEVTQEPEVTESPESTQEPPIPTDVFTGKVILRADFDGDVSGWIMGDGASIVPDGENNNVLLMAPGSNFLPADAVMLTDFRLDLRFNIASDAEEGTASGMSILFRTQEGRAYVLALESTQLSLSRDDGEGPVALASVEAVLDLDIWHTLSLDAQGAQITASVDEVALLEHTDDLPLEQGQLALVASYASSVKIDDVVVTDLTPPAAEETPVPTAVPLEIAEENQHKVDGVLLTILEMYLSGDQAGALELANTVKINISDDGSRVGVVVWAAEDLAGESLVPMVEAIGGVIESVTDHSVKAQVPLTGLVALANLDEVAVIRLQSTITSTDNLSSEMLLEPTGTLTEGYDAVSVYTWHKKNIIGNSSNAKVAILDIGFNGVTSGGEYSCVSNPTSPVGGTGTGNHGARVAQVVCDIVPADNSVTLYTVASDGSNLATRIAQAQVNHKVILITLDLGANATPGDGTGGNTSLGGGTDFDQVYDAIRSARVAGKIIVVSAGNNNNRYVSFQHSSSGQTVTFFANAGDRVNVSWNDWNFGSTAHPTINLSGASGGSYNNRASGEPPSAQFVIAGTGNHTLTFSGTTGFYIQVQVASEDSTSLITGGTAPVDATAGNIGRPADSQDVIAVGAVCVDRENNFPILPNSSHGPIFAANGSGPLAVVAPFNRDQVKPDLMGPSQVSTTLGLADSCTTGFGGTSAAAAHVAGMAALLVANTNASMSSFDNASADAVDAVQNYLQTHAIEMPFGAGIGGADGFDMTYGAGMTVLGNPDFDLTKVMNPIASPDNIDETTGTGYCPDGNYLFVGLAPASDPGAPLGTQLNPYVHPAAALAAAPADTCVIAMPGEYTTPIYVNGLANNVKLISYDSAIYADVADSIFWAQNMYFGALDRFAAFYINNANPFALDGFTFAPPNVFDSVAEPNVILVDGDSGAGSVNGIAVRNNIVNNFVYSNVIPVQVVNGAQDVTIERNTFIANNSKTNLPGVLRVTDSGDVAPILVALNNFKDNVANAIGSTLQWQPIVDVVDSEIHLMSNLFNNNTAETIIHSKTATNRETRILGNVFLNNTTATTEIPFGNSGPLINVEKVPRLYFVNNTVANSNLTNVTFGSIIGRGNNVGGEGGGFLEIHNNIFYNNVAPEGLFKDFVGPTGCTDFADGSNNANEGAYNNWIHNDVAFGPFPFGECATSIAGNGNITAVNPSPRFLGNQPAVPGGFTPPPATSPLFYALIDPNINPGEPDGIEDGRDSFYTTHLVATFTRDAAGKARRTDGDGNNTPLIDIGAYELVVLRITLDPINVDLFPGVFDLPFNEDAGPFQIPLVFEHQADTFTVEGGFGELTFQITNPPPKNFGTQCGPEFAGTKGLVIVGRDVVNYCPPRDFYTDDTDAPNIIPDRVTFKYRVTDETGASEEGTVNLTVNPQPDPAFGTGGVSIGDNVPEGDVFEIVANTNTLVVFRLRPYVNFSNFFFSERNNPETAISQQTDYPYTYGDLNCVWNPNPGNVFPPTIVPQTKVGLPGFKDGHGYIELNLIGNNNKTIGDCTYTVDGVTNNLRIRVVSIIPNEGLHDDSSLVFDYSDGWSALYSEDNINNTLHQSRQANDLAQFQFVGPGFVLYMQGESSGGNWELRMGTAPGVPVAADDPGWVLQPNGEMRATFQTGAVTCVTRAATEGKLISNRTRDPYTISCSGLSAADVHTVNIINRESKRLDVDAFAIIENDANPDLLLGPGFHDVDELEFTKRFAPGVEPAWEEITDRKATNERALATRAGTVVTAPFDDPGSADFDFSFTSGTGFAIGTILEDAVDKDGIGAQYTVCVEEKDSGNPTCQSFDNGLGGSTRASWEVFRPFFGFDPLKTYDVTVNLTNIPAGERMVLDSIVVFNDQVTGALSKGATEDDRRDMFVFGNGLDDSWVYDTNNRKVTGGSLTSLDRGVVAAGPFISFRIPNEADTVLWYRLADRKDSQNALICVDRPDGMAGDHGNCIVVDLQTGMYRQQDAAGAFGPEIAPIQPASGVIAITQDLFRANWAGAGEHTVEIFSLTDENFSFDKVQVLNSADTDPLPAGFYEEYTTGLRFFDFDPGPETYTLLPLGDDGLFVDETDRKASGGVVKTLAKDNLVTNDGLKDGMLFHFHGTGFSILFTQDKFADAVNICWTRGTINGLGATVVDDVLGGTCTVFDNQNRRTNNLFGRTILGLDEDDYTVAVQLLDENFLPKTHDQSREVPISMKIDAVQIFDDPWFTPGDWDGLADLGLLMIPGMRYEPSYDNRAADNLFQYFGDGWRSFTGSKARRQSGENYDEIKKVAGAGVLFRTDGADAMILYRDTKRGYAPLQVCVAPVNTGTDQVTLADRYCTTVYNDGTTENQEPFGVLFNTTGDTGPHVVSITTLDDGGFIFDAIELVNTDTYDGLVNGSSYRILGPGMYEDYIPAIVYDRHFESVLTNGDMERDADWTEIGGLPAANNTQATGPKYVNRNSRHVTALAGGQGIESAPVELVPGRTYTIVARVYPVSGIVEMTDDTASFSVTTNTVPALPLNEWHTLRHDFVAGGTAMNLRFIAGDGAPAEFYVDDVSIVSGGDWMPIYNRKYSDERMMESQNHGAQMTFTFSGTGFEIGTLQDKSGGDVEVCYKPGQTTDFSGANCFTYQNEYKRTEPYVSYTVAGLPNNVYSVRVRDVEDGFTVIGRAVTDNRDSRYGVGKLRVDYIRVFDAAPPTLLTEGFYNDNAVNPSGDLYLQTLPLARWEMITGRSARKYSGESFTTIVDDRDRSTNDYAGPVGILTVNQNATVILYTDKTSRSNSDQLLVCADEVNGKLVWDGLTMSVDGSTDCTLLDGFTQSPQVVINRHNLPALGDAGSHVLTFRTLTPGALLIDHYQILEGDVLPEGFYEDFIDSDPVSTDILDKTSGIWSTDENRRYSGGSALEGLNDGVNPATLEFSFTGTGFSLVTYFDRSGGDINVQIARQGGGDYNNGAGQVISTNDTKTVYGAAHTFAGLPFDTYDVTITNQTSNKLIIDAIQVYGTLSELGSLYDDAQLNAGGNLLLTYGPNNDIWKAESGNKARGYLNETYHLAKSYGASVSFMVGDANSIILYTGKGSKAQVEICWTRTQPTISAQVCNPLVDTSTAEKFTIQNPVGGGTQYAVSITSKSHNSNLYIDAVQIIEPGPLSEGIYDVPYLNTPGLFPNQLPSTNAFNGAWVDDGSFKSGGFNASLDFVFTGTGFSIVLSEDAGRTSANYELCVTPGDTGTTSGTTCNTIDKTGVNKLLNTDSRVFAITYLGLHSGSGGSATYSVSLKNTDPFNNLLVERVEVFGAKDPALKIADFERYEDDSPQLHYFPFGSLTKSETRRGETSGNSQYIGDVNGSAIYFEFVGQSFEYFRELSTRYGQVEICFGLINDAGAVTADRFCANHANDTERAYQRPISIDPQALDGTDCTTGNGCWVSIRNLDGKKMPVDFIRLFDPSSPLIVGYYEVETHPSLRFFDYDGAVYNLLPAGDDGLFVNEDVRQASSGVVKTLKKDTVVTDDGLMDGMLFHFNGTGFSVRFIMDKFADAVNICWVRGIETTVANVLAGTCQVFDNQNRRTEYQAARTILGLDQSDYTVAVQLLDDNFIPDTHDPTREAVTMKLDSIQIYDDPWFTTGAFPWTDSTYLNVLTPGMRYETSYDKRVEDKRFLYYGEDWKSYTGSRARKESGENYDEIRKVFGAGVLFRTNGADAMILYRDTKRNYAPLRVCVAPVNTGTDQVTFGSMYCTTVYNDDGTSYQEPFGILFNTVGSTGPHVVSITTLDGGNFVFDAVELVNTDTYDGLVDGLTYRILGPGMYEDNHPGLVYDRHFASVLVNGDMERDADWTSIVGNEPLTNERYSRKDYLNRYSRHVVAVAGGEGIESAPFPLMSGRTYTVVARVFVVDGLVRMRDTQGNFSLTTDAALNGDWQMLYANFTAGGDVNDQLQFTASGGAAEFYVDDVSVVTGNVWKPIFHRKYSEGRMMESQYHGAQMDFVFNGTGFAIGMLTDREGGEVEICYVENTAPDFSAANCFTYQNESKRTNTNVSYSVAGLPEDTYKVRVRDVEDGYTVLTKTSPDPRNSRYPVGQLRIDYVRVFDGMPPLVPPGYYEDNAVDANGDTYLHLLPDSQWSNITGNAARRYSGESYTTVVDDRERSSKDYAGPVAVMKVDVPSADGVTIILYTGKASRSNTDQLLVCVDNVNGALTWDGSTTGLADTTDCALVDTLPSSDYVVLNPTLLPELATVGQHIVTFRALTPGYFSIDNYQVIEGTTLTPGIYDEFIAGGILRFNPALNPDTRGCDEGTEWCSNKSSKAFGGYVAETNQQDATLTFDITGTGFSVITEIASRGVDMRVCYKRTENPTDFPAGDEDPDPDPILDADGIWCEKFTTNSSSTSWDNLNGDRPNPRSASQYGFAYYGLPFGDYTVEVRVVDAAIGSRDYLRIDAIAVFGDVTTMPLMTSGLYDDPDATVMYGPEPFWSVRTYRNGPTKGAWGLSEHIASNAGSIAQVYMEGNALTVYQTAESRGSEDIRICLIVTGDVIHCSELAETRKAAQSSNFSQDSRRRTYFTPIVFYGLGDGSHQIIFENREHGRNFTIDALRPWD